MDSTLIRISVWGIPTQGSYELYYERLVANRELFSSVDALSFRMGAILSNSGTQGNLDG